MKKGFVALLLLLSLALSLPAFAEPTATLPKDADAFLTALPEGFSGISANALKQKLDMGEKVFLLDVREPGEFAAGHIQGAVNIPIRQLGKEMGKLPADKKAQIVVYCRSGQRGSFGLMALSMAGYTNVKNLAFGYAIWEMAGFPKTAK